MINTVELGTLITPAKTVRCGNGHYPILSMTMHNGLVFQDEKFKKVIASKDTSDYKVVFKNQLVISFPIDEGVLAAQRIADAGIVSPAYGIWDIDQSQVIPEYLEYALRCNRALQYYKAKLRGSTARRRSLPTPTLLAFTVPLPSKKDQIYILDRMHKAKSLIEKRKAQLSMLDDLIKARFVEMFGNPVDNNIGWKTISLDEACNGVGDGLHGTPDYDDDGEYPFINGNNLIDGSIEITQATKYVNEETYKKHFIDISDNAILISINGTLGKLAFYKGEEVMLGKSACYCNLKPDIKREFVYGVMKSDAFARFLDENSTASTIKNVGLKAMRSFKLIMPPEDLQNSFIDFAKQVDKSKVAVQKALDEAQLLFDSLMQEYFG